MKTREEVEALKANWLGDPCYDIEDAPGFEDYGVELAGFAVEHRKLWEEARKKCEARAYYDTLANETTLRDWFAVHAMEGIISNIKSRDSFIEHLKETGEDSYRLADAMMEARRG